MAKYEKVVIYSFTVLQLTVFVEKLSKMFTDIYGLMPLPCFSASQISKLTGLGGGGAFSLTYDACNTTFDIQEKNVKRVSESLFNHNFSEGKEKKLQKQQHFF
jgi:hypothetical protein